MSQQDNIGNEFTKMNQRIKERFPNAKFDIFMTESSLKRIVSYNKYIVVAWLGDICCGAEEHGHREPKTYVVQSSSNQFITMYDVINTLVEKEFEVPCAFCRLNDIVPAVNPLDPLEAVYFFSMDMSYCEK